MSIPNDLLSILTAAATVGAACVVFGISAFGAALFTVPLLAARACGRRELLTDAPQ